MADPTDDGPLRVVVADDHPVYRRGPGRAARVAAGLAVVGTAADGAAAVALALEDFVDFPSELSGDRTRRAENASELAEQQAKNADIITLHEIENSAVLTPQTPYRAVEPLLAAIEQADGHDWTYVQAHEDSGVITTGGLRRSGVRQGPLPHRPDVPLRRRDVLRHRQPPEVEGQRLRDRRRRPVARGYRQLQRHPCPQAQALVPTTCSPPRPCGRS